MKYAQNVVLIALLTGALAACALGQEDKKGQRPAAHPAAPHQAPRPAPRPAPAQHSAPAHVTQHVSQMMSHTTHAAPRAVERSSQSAHVSHSSSSHVTHASTSHSNSSHVAMPRHTVDMTIKEKGHSSGSSAHASTHASTQSTAHAQAPRTAQAHASAQRTAQAHAAAQRTAQAHASAQQQAQAHASAQRTAQAHASAQQQAQAHAAAQRTAQAHASAQQQAQAHAGAQRNAQAHAAAQQQAQAHNQAVAQGQARTRAQQNEAAALSSNMRATPRSTARPFFAVRNAAPPHVQAFPHVTSSRVIDPQAWSGRDHQRSGFHPYTAGLAISAFAYPHYLADPSTRSYPAPSYYYSDVPGYVDDSYIVVSDDPVFDWDDGTTYAYVSGRTYNEYPLDYSVDCIQNDFHHRHASEIIRLLPNDGYVSIEFNNQPRYGLSCHDYGLMMDDVIDQTNTVSYDVEHVYRHGDDCTVVALHEYRDPRGELIRQRHWYGLRRHDTGFSIVSFRASIVL